MNRNVTHMKGLALALGVLSASMLIAPRTAQAQRVAAANLHPLAVEDLIAVKEVSRLALSPDGERVLVVTHGMDLASNAVVSQTFIAETRSHKAVLPLGPEAAHAEWSSDGQTLTYLKTGGDCTRVWSVSLRPLEAEEQLSECLQPQDREPTGHRWSPDSRYLAYLAQKPTNDPLEAWTKRAVALNTQTETRRCIDVDSEEGRAKGMDALDQACTGTSVGTGWMWGLDVASPALRYYAAIDNVLPPVELWVMEVSTGAARRISAATKDVRQFAWSDHGHELNWLELERNAKRDDDVGHQSGQGSSLSFGGKLAIAWTDAAIVGAPIQTIPIDTVTAIDLLDIDVRRSPDGKSFAFGTSENLKVYAALASPTAPAPKEIFSGRLEDFEWSADSRYLYLSSYDRQQQTLLAVDAQSGSFRPVLANPHWQGVPSFSADRRSFVLTIEDVAQPARVYLGRIGSRSLREVLGHAELNPHWLNVEPLSYERVAWRSWDDRWDLSGVLIGSDETRPKSPRATVVVIRGAGAPADFQFGLDNQQPVLLLAAAGYTVFIPNTRGRSGITTHGHDDLSRERTYFSKPWRDVLQSVDLLVEQGVIDPGRIGIMGFSYGGGLTGWGITQSPRFKAAIVKEPVDLNMAAAWRSMWGHPDRGRDTVGKRFGIDNPYEGSGAQFIEYETPLSHVKSVRTPTLLEFGVKSGNAAGGNAFYHGLVTFGIPAELILYPRTIHGFEEPTILADSYRRELAWFARWLRP